MNIKLRYRSSGVVAEIYNIFWAELRETVKFGANGDQTAVDVARSWADSYLASGHCVIVWDLL